jgi:NitT/TauT family transport system ATP-binding protein
LQATVFLITHSVAEAVYLADRIWIFTQAPGTIGRVITDLPARKAPAEEMQQRPEFLDAVRSVGEAFQQVMNAR